MNYFSCLYTNLSQQFNSLLTNINFRLTQNEAEIKEINAELAIIESKLKPLLKANQIYVALENFDFYGSPFLLGDNGYLSIGPGVSFYQGNFTIYNTKVVSTASDYINFSFSLKFTSPVKFVHITSFKIVSPASSPNTNSTQAPLLGGYIESNNQSIQDSFIFSVSQNQLLNRYVCHFEGCFLTTNFGIIYPSLTYEDSSTNFNIVVEQGSFFLVNQYSNTYG